MILLMMKILKMITKVVVKTKQIKANLTKEAIEDLTTFQSFSDTAEQLEKFLKDEELKEKVKRRNKIIKDITDES
jgi:hypothetical protein